jgi:hypothetical protein
VVSGVRAADIAAVVGEWSARLTFAGIEDQYLAINPSTMKAISAIRGRWMQELERVGVCVEVVNTKTWQSGMLAGLISVHSRRKAVKSAAALVASSVFRLRLTEDEADAALIATWLARNRELLTRR